MTVSLEKYDDLFKRLIRKNSDARAVEQEQALCTSDTYESAKTYGFKPVLVDPEQLEVMSEDTRALMIAYALGKTIYGEDYFCQPLEKLLDSRELNFYKREAQVSLGKTRKSFENAKKGKMALKMIMQMIVKAGYSLGDALEGYYKLGHDLDPFVVHGLAEQYRQDKLFSAFGYIETEEVPADSTGLRGNWGKE